MHHMYHSKIRNAMKEYHQLIRFSYEIQLYIVKRNFF